jgi:hypothetical protein
MPSALPSTLFPSIQPLHPLQIKSYLYLQLKFTYYTHPNTFCMKWFILLLTCVIYSSLTQAITLLYRGPSGWNNDSCWIQVNIPVGQTPISRVPLYSDDVLFSSAMSGITSFSLDGSFMIGNGPGSLCRSMQIRNTQFNFINSMATDRAGSVDIFTASGGFLSADSGTNIQKGIFYLHGGNPAVTDLRLTNSSCGQLFTHGQFGGMELYNNARVRFINSHLEGDYFVNSSPDARFYADNCEFITPSFQMGANTTDSIFNSTIKPGNGYVTLQFTIGPGANFVSANLNVSSLSWLRFISSGSTFNGNVSLLYPGDLYLDQLNHLAHLPNIINGNLSTGETNVLNINGKLKISGSMIFNTPAEAVYAPTMQYVNGQPAFITGGIGWPNTTPPHIEFFGNTDSEVRWPLGFPLDSMVLNKTGCAKLRFLNSLYVRGKATLLQGQLVLDPNSGIPYKFVCAGDLELMNGAGIFLRRNAQNLVASMAVQGHIIDHNPVADSTCTGISNPYGGDIFLYRNLADRGNNIISIAHPQGLPRLRIYGRPGSGYMLGAPLTVSSPFNVQAGELRLNNYALTVVP